MSLMVSVVIPTYRRPQLLERCLQAVLSQTFPPQAYEVIVVDDDPSDPVTRSLVMEWQMRLQSSHRYVTEPVVTLLPVTGDARANTQENELVYQVSAGRPQAPGLVYVNVERNGGPAAARNLGWRVAQGEIIAFTDDDCLPEPDWLVNGVGAFVDNVAGVSGRVIVPIGPHPTDHELNYTALERSDFVTANCFYRRKALEDVGGFDERFKLAWREDSDLYFAFQQKNYPLAWASGAVVIHPVRPAAWGSSIQQQKKSFFNALLYKKYPKLYWRYIQPSPPWQYYGTILALAAAASGVIAKIPALALAGAGVWLYLYVSFVIRRLHSTSRTLDHVFEMLATSLVIPFISIYWRLCGALHWRVFFL